jgi:hypothetical protein
MFFDRIYNWSDTKWINLTSNLKRQYIDINFDANEKLNEILTTFRNIYVDLIFEELVTSGILNKFEVNLEITDKTIGELSIYRTSYSNDKPNKDSVLLATRYFNNGLRVQEVYYFNNKEFNYNDSIWYFYNANKLLTKVVETSNYYNCEKNTIQFSYDSLNNITKSSIINQKNEIKKASTYTRFYNKNRQIEMLYDSTTLKDFGLMASKTKYIYDDNHVLLKTLFYSQYSSIGRDGTTGIENPNVKRKLDKNFLSVIDVFKKNDLYIQIVHYTTNSKNKIKCVDRYHYK